MILLELLAMRRLTVPGLPRLMQVRALGNVTTINIALNLKAMLQMLDIDC